MVSFRRKLAQSLVVAGVQVCDDLADTPYQAVLVIGGSRQLPQIWRARQRGVRIVQRLDGMNWLHRLRRTGLRHFLRAEYGNWLLAMLRSRLADAIVYQSHFSRRWWEDGYGAAPVPSMVIHNGVDLSLYNPQGMHSRPDDRARVLLVEGSLMGGYEMSLDVAIKLVSGLRDAYSYSSREWQVELMVVGRVSDQVIRRWQEKATVPITWAGLVDYAQIPEIDRSAHLLYSADVNPACPNSVIEALACGLPVLAFDTGALSELVPGTAGCVVPYGGNPWRLDPPDVPALVADATYILDHQDIFRQGARQHAEGALGLDRMAQAYLQVLLEA